MLSLREWESARPAPGTILAQRSLAAFPHGRQLAEELTRTGRMEVLELACGLELRATSFVGRFLLGDLTVTVHPKISGAPLLSLFRYAYSLRDLDRYAPSHFATSVCSFQDLIIQQLAAEVSELLERGIHRDYEYARSDLASPRGRIDFTRYLHTAQRNPKTLPCIHHPRIQDTFLNRVLLSGLNFAAHLATDIELKGQIRRIAKTLGATVSAQPLHPQTLAEAWRAMDRRTASYRSALTVIELLIADQGAALDQQRSRVQLKGFLFDMNRFFQALISRFLREHLDDVEVHDEYRLKGMFKYLPGENPLARKGPTLRPDFVLMRGPEAIAVLDAKYRDLWDQSLPREMLYQLALYAFARVGGERVSGILYPTMDPAAREQVIAIQEPVSGRAMARVVLRPVNLLALEQLLKNGPLMHSRRVKLAQQLAFGQKLEGALTNQL